MRKLLSTALPIFVVLLVGCQSVSKRISAVEDFAASQTPPTDIQRTADLPLAVSIPGLNIPLYPVGSRQFGKLNEMLKAEGIPSFTIGYDDKIRPLSNAAGLFAGDYSIAATRILPTLESAVEEENAIRRHQNIPPLKELTLISYSQGSVLALDFLRNLIIFRENYDALNKSAGTEWDTFLQDPEFKNLKIVLDDFLVVRNMRAQNEKSWDTSYDFQRFYKRSFEKMKKAFRRFETYLTAPEKLYPGTRVFSGDESGYPRKYPQILAWFLKRYPQTGSEDSLPVEFFFEYVSFEPFIPLNVRLFSICGSFFGSPKADSMYDLIKLLPGSSDRLIAGPIKEQIKDTRLGNLHHLIAVKDLLTYFKKVGIKREFENTYFMVGVFGERGDGMVSQSSAHFSSHLYTQVPTERLSNTQDTGALELPYDQLPNFAVTPLRIKHLPQTHLLIFKTPGAAEMYPGAPVYPFLSAFVKKDFSKLEKLHTDLRHRLRQFMVELYLPPTDEFKGYRFKLKSSSKEIKMQGEFYNKNSRTYVWMGTFRAKKNFFDSKRLTPPPNRTVTLVAEKRSAKPIEIKILVEPGVNHFLEITPRLNEALTGIQMSDAEKVYDWVPGENLAA